MPFKDAPAQAVMGDALVTQEHDILRLWKKTQAFERGRARRHKHEQRYRELSGVTVGRPAELLEDDHRANRHQLCRFRLTR